MIFASNSWASFWEKVGNFFIKVDEDGINLLTRIIFAIVLIVLSFVFIKIIELVLKRILGVRKKGPQMDYSAKIIIIAIIKGLLWIGCAVGVIATLKIDMTGFAGITSAVTVALGLALQDLIGCFASGVLIINQKHIRTGDYIMVTNEYGSCEGTVTKIHYFFTYLKTYQGQEVTIPNNNMTKAVVTNYTRLGMRRIDYLVGISYDSDFELAKEVLLGLVKDDERVLKDQPCVSFPNELSAYSVKMILRFWVKAENYWEVYLSLNEKVLKAFKENKIKIPSSTDIQVNK